MRTILFSFFVLSFTAYAGVLKSSPLDVKIKAALSKCRSAVNIIDNEFPDTVACPKAFKYTFKNAMTLSELKNVVESELNFSLVAKTSEWESLLANSFEIQNGFAAESLSEGSGQYPEKDEEKLRRAIRDAEVSVRDFSRLMIIKGRALGSKVYVDPETFWGPKVKAHALIILNAPRKSVDVYLHGDLDG
jgi:hypothetical protein